MNNFEIDAVLYFINSFAVLFSDKSGFNRDFPIDLQKIVLLSFIIAKPPANNGASLLFIINEILFKISSSSVIFEKNP